MMDSPIAPAGNEPLSAETESPKAGIEPRNSAPRTRMIPPARRVDPAKSEAGVARSASTLPCERERRASSEVHAASQVEARDFYSQTRSCRRPPTK
jgi:hypothetical protein